MKFGNEGNDLTFVNFNIQKTNGEWFPLNGSNLVGTTAVENLKELLNIYGFDATGITDKSAKMAGVTASFRAGASLEEVAHQGRWKTTDIPLTYKHNSGEYKTKTVENVVFE